MLYHRVLRRVSKHNTSTLHLKLRTVLNLTAVGGILRERMSVDPNYELHEGCGHPKPLLREAENTIN